VGRNRSRWCGGIVVRNNGVASELARLIGSGVSIGVSAAFFDAVALSRRIRAGRETPTRLSGPRSRSGARSEDSASPLTRHFEA
jgi:hypothetical protein